MKQLVYSLALVFLMQTSVWAGFTFSESFKDGTAAGWTTFQQGSSPAARLTAGATAISGDPETGTIDTAGDGWLRLTNETNNQSNGYVLDTAIPSVDNTIFIEFEVAMWSTKATAADGITFFMFDAAETFSPGADGGSMAYAQKIAAEGGGTDQEGVPGGYLAVGIDNYGNFSNPTEGRTTGPGFTPNAVVVRGEGEKRVGGPLDGGWYDGYDYLAGTGGVNTSLPGDPAIAALVDDLDFINTSVRPDTTGLDHRSFQIELNDSDELIVRLKVGASGSFVELFKVENLADRPDQLRIGFSGGTGGLNQILELRNFSAETFGGANVFTWDSDAGSTVALRRWGATGGLNNFEDNWDGDINPFTSGGGNTPTVIFSDEHVTSNQTIRVQDGDKTVKDIFFSGEHRYRLRATTIGSPDPNLNPTLILDSGAVGGASTIGVLNSPSGNSDHRIDLDIDALNDVEINHFVPGHTLDLRGTFDLGSNNMKVNTAGTVDLRDIEGTGDITKEGDGVLYLRNHNDDFFGDFIVEEGILRANRARSLGPSGSGDVTVKDGAALELRGTGNIVGKTLNIEGSGVGGTGALRSILGTNSIWSGDVNLTGDTTFGADTGTKLRVDGDISGVGQDLTITGDGTVDLRGDNTYTGETIVDSGTLLLNGDGVNQPLGGTSKLVVNTGGTVIFNKANQINPLADVDLNGGILDTNGNAQTVGTMTFSTTSTIVLGGNTLTLDDLVRTGGTLIVDDYTFDGQFTATPGSVDAATLDNIFFADQGILGAIQLPSGHIVPRPIPEASTYAAGLALALIAGAHWYRKRCAKRDSESSENT